AGHTTQRALIKVAPLSVSMCNIRPSVDPRVFRERRKRFVQTSNRTCDRSLYRALRRERRRARDPRVAVGKRSTKLATENVMALRDETFVTLRRPQERACIGVIWRSALVVERVVEVSFRADLSVVDVDRRKKESLSVARYEAQRHRVNVLAFAGLQ